MDGVVSAMTFTSHTRCSTSTRNESLPIGGFLSDSAVARQSRSRIENAGSRIELESLFYLPKTKQSKGILGTGKLTRAEFLLVFCRFTRASIKASTWRSALSLGVWPRPSCLPKASHEQSRFRVRKWRGLFPEARERRNPGAAPSVESRLARVVCHIGPAAWKKILYE